MGKRKKQAKKAVSAGFNGLYPIVEVFIPILVLCYILWNFQTQITNVKMFSIFMTLGGLETYNDTVVGIFMILLLVGVYFATRD